METKKTFNILCTYEILQVLFLVYIWIMDKSKHFMLQNQKLTIIYAYIQLKLNHYKNSKGSIKKGCNGKEEKFFFCWSLWVISGFVWYHHKKKDSFSINNIFPYFSFSLLCVCVCIQCNIILIYGLYEINVKLFVIWGNKELDGGHKHCVFLFNEKLLLFSISCI